MNISRPHNEYEISLNSLVVWPHSISIQPRIISFGRFCFQLISIWTHTEWKKLCAQSYRASFFSWRKERKEREKKGTNEGKKKQATIAVISAYMLLSCEPVRDLWSKTTSDAMNVWPCAANTMPPNKVLTFWEISRFLLRNKPQRHRTIKQ